MTESTTKDALTQYTTGELAKRCGVSVRTVQYYDNRGVLVPSEVSSGGRRLSGWHAGGGADSTASPARISPNLAYDAASQANRHAGEHGYSASAYREGAESPDAATLPFQVSPASFVTYQVELAH